jgi:hypothetical protein
MPAFPPLPAISTAPQTGADPRQSRARAIIGNVHNALGASAPAIAVRGYHAAAVNVGEIQGKLETCLKRFDEAKLESRWDEILAWTSDFLRVWVQRCKEMRIERHGPALHVCVTAQDDLGYYTYHFDVFPARASSSEPAAVGKKR